MKNIVENQGIKNDKPLALTYEQLKAQLDAVVAECATLKQFFQKGIEISFDGCDWDGGSIQDFAFGISQLTANHCHASTLKIALDSAAISLLVMTAMCLV